MQVLSETQETIRLTVEAAFLSAWSGREQLSNNKRSSRFVSELSRIFKDKYQAIALVQETDIDGNKTSGEWLLDIMIVTKKEIITPDKKRKTTVVDNITWAIESEFSTDLHEFFKDFTKLLYLKADAYLYIAGLNQETERSREKYIETQCELAAKLVEEKQIKVPFFIVFVPSPANRGGQSLWDKFTLDCLKSWICCYKLA